VGGCGTGCSHGSDDPAAAGVRSTKQREAILGTIRSAPGPMSAQEILKSAKRRSAGLGLATVYRNIKGLFEGGLLTEVNVPGEPPRYEVAGKTHHHHFLCGRCGTLFDIPGCPGDLSSLVPAGFSLEAHDLTLMGVCAGCNRRQGLS